MKNFLLVIIACLLSSIVTAQNVGVGTAAPIEKMHIAGNVRTDNGLVMWPGIFAANAAIAINVQYSTVRITMQAGVQANAVSYTATAAEGQLLVIANEDDDAATFIGATIPSTEARAFIYTNGTWRPMSGAAAAANAWLLLGNAGTNPAVNFIGTTDAQHFVVRTNNIERARFLSTNGYMGWGTTTPTAEVHIVNGASGSWFGNTLPSVDNTSTFGAGWRMQAGGVGAQNWAIHSTGTSNPQGVGKLVFYNLSTSTNAMTITAGCNVGIATTTPNTRLDINGDFALLEGGAVAINGSNQITPGVSSHIRITNAGTINEIMVPYNGKNLYLINNSGGSIVLANNAVATANKVYTGSGANYTMANQSGVHLIYNSTLTAWEIVGTSPASAAGNNWALLGNAGTVDGTNFLGTTDAVPMNFRVNNQKAGRIEEAAATANAFFGYQAGNVNSTGTYNVGVGYQTLQLNTSGWYNTTMGYQAMQNNTTGGLNTAIGAQALYTQSYNNGGVLWNSYNVAVGYQALYSNQPTSAANGWHNVGVGVYALRANITGTSNSAFGDQALRNNTTGNSNTASGAEALNSNTTGNFNTSAGRWSLRDNTTASNNTATGGLSLIFNTTGGSNTANGALSHYNNLTGWSNVAIGANSMFNQSTTSFNVAVGDSALVGVLGSSTTGSHVAIGYTALAGNTTGASNVAVGYQALKNNSTGNSNSAVGYNALLTNTTGGANVAIGLQALTANTTGGSNIAVGVNSMLSNTTGSFNTIMGTSTMQNNTSGNNNTAVGYQSMLANTIGNDNAAYGEFSLNNNTVGSNNVAIGPYALRFQSFNNGGVAYASNNTAVGFQALQNNQPTTNSNGYRNTGVGAFALNANTTGSQNTVLGFNAMSGNTTGIQNTSAGAWSMLSNSSGSNNVAYGNSALQNNSTGNDNTALGTGAVWQTTSGENTGVGSFVLSQNVNGSRNSAFGRLASGSNTSGSYNTSVGMYAHYFSQTGSNNTVVGYQAAFGVINNSISNSAILGYNAGYALTTGSNNILFGFQAGDAITTGANNIIIGYDIDAPVATGNQQLSIGNLIFGTGLNGTGTTISTGNIGIGVTAPGGQFELSLDQGRKPGTNTWTITSDARLKQVNGSFDKGLAEVLKLNPIRYNYVANETRKLPTDLEFVGYTAQDVQKVFPEAVTLNKDGYYDFNMHAILVAYTNAIKELNAEIEKLKSQNAALQVKSSEVDELKTRLQQIEARLGIQAGTGK